MLRIRLGLILVEINDRIRGSRPVAGLVRDVADDRSVACRLYKRGANIGIKINSEYLIRDERSRVDDFSLLVHRKARGKKFHLHRLGTGLGYIKPLVSQLDRHSLDNISNWIG